MRGASSVGPGTRWVRPVKWPTAVDLFSGIGGLSAGLREARFRVIGAVERDGLAAETYRSNFPGVFLWEADIRELDPKVMMRDLSLPPGELGLLAACPPCQGFSTVRARRRRTVRDGRNQLLLDVVRFAEALRPRTLMLENVPGLARYGLFQKALASLRRLGYEVEWGVRDAADFGVPQRRKRLILAAARVGVPTLPRGAGARRTVRQTIGRLPVPGKSGDPLHDLVEHRSSKVTSIIRRIPKDGGSRTALGKDQLPCHRRVDGFKDVYGRMAWDQVAPTITGGCVNPSKGRFLHPEQHRCITLREALLLQGFAKSFRLSLSRGKFPAAALVGNAIPPALACAHASELRPLAARTPAQYSR